MHVDVEVDKFEAVHGGNGFGVETIDGDNMLLEFADKWDWLSVVVDSKEM